MSDLRADLAELLAKVERMTRCGGWRPGAVDKRRMFVSHDDGLAGVGGERVILLMNEHFPFQDDIDGVAALVNTAPRYLAALARIAEIVALDNGTETYRLALPDAIRDVLAGLEKP